jgi:hypothetical protein
MKGQTMHHETTRQALRNAYINGANMETAAADCGICLRTAYAWKAEAKAAGDDWNRLRAVCALEDVETVTQDIVRRMTNIYAQTAEELYADTQTPAVKRAEVLATLADALAKTVAANKRMMPQASALAQSVHTPQLLTDFTTEHFPQHAAALAEIIEPFGEVLQKAV